MSQTPTKSQFSEIEAAVRQRYANALEFALCCPTSCDRRLLADYVVTTEAAPVCKPGSCC